jgi:hypothetical protein
VAQRVYDGGGKDGGHAALILEGYLVVASGCIQLEDEGGYMDYLQKAGALAKSLSGPDLAGMEKGRGEIRLALQTISKTAFLRERRMLAAWATQATAEFIRQAGWESACADSLVTAHVSVAEGLGPYGPTGKHHVGEARRLLITYKNTHWSQDWEKRIKKIK